MNTNDRFIWHVIMLLMFLTLLQCSSSDAPNIPAVGESFCMDLDGDGVAGYYTRDSSDSDADMLELDIITCDADEYDCADDDALRTPGKIEIADNGIDENCDYTDATLDLGVDDDTPDDPAYATTTCDGGVAETTYYQDLDGDGYGVSTTTQNACTRPSGYALVSTDCDDANSGVHPGATEVTSDSVDQDCDGGVDSMECETMQTYFLDADGDGYRGDENLTQCYKPTGNYYLASEAESEGSATYCVDGDSSKYTNPGMSGKDYGYLVYQADPASARWIPATIKAQLLALSPEPGPVPNFGSTSPVLSGGHVVMAYESTFTNELGLPEPSNGEGVITNNFLDKDNDCDGVTDEDGTTEDDYQSTEIAQVIDGYINGHGIYFDRCPSTDGKNAGAFNYYTDADDDEYGDENATANYQCQIQDPQDQSLVANNTDCRDDIYLANPGQTGRDYSNYQGDSANYDMIDNDCDGTFDNNKSEPSNTWSTTVAFNGVCFDQYKESDSSSEPYFFPTEITKLENYIKADNLVLNSTDLNFNIKTVFDNASKLIWPSTSVETWNNNSHHSYKSYFTGMRINSAYAQFWHNSKTIDYSDASCGDDSRECETKFDINLTEADSSNTTANITSTFLAEKKATVFLRGIYFNQKDTHTPIEDMQSKITLESTNITNSSVRVKIKVVFKTSKKTDFEVLVPYTVMAYDPNFIYVDPFSVLTDSNNFTDVDDSSHDRITTQENVGHMYLNEYTAIDTFGSANTSQVGSALYSWGFDWGDPQGVNRLKALSYISEWDPPATNCVEEASCEFSAKINTKGVGYHNITGDTKNPDRMGSMLIVCANSDVCEMKFTDKEKNSTDASEQAFEISF